MKKKPMYSAANCPQSPDDSHLNCFVIIQDIIDDVIERENYYRFDEYNDKLMEDDDNVGLHGYISSSLPLQLEDSGSVSKDPDLGQGVLLNTHINSSNERYLDEDEDLMNILGDVLNEMEKENTSVSKTSFSDKDNIELNDVLGEIYASLQCEEKTSVGTNDLEASRDVLCSAEYSGKTVVNATDDNILKESNRAINTDGGHSAGHLSTSDIVKNHSL